MKETIANEKFDYLMLNIAKECGDISSFMDLFFSFLLRKTDFITNSKNYEQCEQVVLDALKKQYDKRQLQIDKIKQENARIDEERKKKRLEEENEIKQEKKKEPEKREIEKKLEIKEKEKENSRQQEEAKEEGEEEAPKGNGGETAKYIWTQTLNTVDIHIKPTNNGSNKKRITKEDIKIVITNSKLKLSIQGEEIIDGEFYAKIKSEDSTWYVEDNQLHIMIDKFKDMEWWPCVIKGDPEIDVKKIVPENSRMQDLDSETRSVVEKMLYDQRRKAANLPTSDEQQKYELLEKFKKMHPEMDFSKANINYGNSSGNMFFGS